jgi:formylglycine-generating enzyme required for sulfatase activity
MKQIIYHEKHIKEKSMNTLKKIAGAALLSAILGMVIAACPNPSGDTFIAVTDITGVPTVGTKGINLALTGTVAPANAANQTIVWSVKDAGTTGAAIDGNTLSTTEAGTVVVTATIANGTAAGTAYTKDFSITINAASVAVSGVSLDKDTLSLYIGDSGTLTATVSPANAANQNVSWSSNDITVATVNAGLVTGVAAGTADITVTTEDGNFTADCTVTVTGVAAGALSTHSISGVSVPFRYVPAGSFQRDGYTGNISVITKGYWMSETEVTQELFQEVMETNPSYHHGGSGREAVAGETQNQRPVEMVSWYDAIAFCNKLSLLAGKEPVYSVSGIDWETLAYSGIPTSSDTEWNAAGMDMSKNGYRLPTEMEWMWAAMGADKTSQPNTTGRNKAFAGSDGNNSIDDYAWYYINADNKTHEVGKKTENELELEDMSGNVWEWCWDWDSSYPDGERTDYTGADSGSHRVYRGGGQDDGAYSCTVAYRRYSGPSNRSGNFGFRVVSRP